MLNFGVRVRALAAKEWLKRRNDLGSTPGASAGKNPRSPTPRDSHNVEQPQSSTRDEPRSQAVAPPRENYRSPTPRDSHNVEQPQSSTRDEPRSRAVAPPRENYRSPTPEARPAPAPDHWPPAPSGADTRDPRTRTTKSATIAAAAAVQPVSGHGSPNSHLGPEAHAARLISWLVNERCVTRGLLFNELLELYHEMTGSLGWCPLPWHPVGRELRKLLGGKKSYVWVTDDGGVDRRLRVYHLVAPAANVIARRIGEP